THVGVVGNTARTHIRDYGRYIVSTADNKEFNEDVQDIVEDLSESIQDANVVNYADLTKVLIQEDDKISEFGENYNTHIRAAKNGLSGNLHYNEVSTKQLKELQRYMRDLNIASKELFEKYGKEYQRSEEHTSELQSRFDLVCRLLLEKKKTINNISI